MLPPHVNISLKSQVKGVLQILQKHKQIEGIPKKSYQSNFEVLIEALSVHRQSLRPAARSFAVLNHEEGSADVFSVFRSAFERIDVFGLRVSFLHAGEESQAIYTMTLSAMRLSVLSNTPSKRSEASGSSLGGPATREIDFSNRTPHYSRGTLLQDLEQALKGQEIRSGWISVLFTKQRSIKSCPSVHSSSSSSAPEDLNFLVVYRVCAGRDLSKMIKLKGLYPSFNFSSGSPELSNYWFGN